MRGNRRSDEAQLIPMYFFPEGRKTGIGHAFTCSQIPGDSCYLFYLLALEPSVFYKYPLYASHGLLCINMLQNVQQEKLIVVNPLTRKTKTLPSLHFRCFPALLHMLYNPADQLYKVIVLGKTDDRHSRETVFNSPASM